MDDPHDWLTQRAAAHVLHEDLGIHPETARRLLVAGVVAGPRVTSLATFYRRDAIDAFVAAQRTRAPLPVPDRNLVFVRVGNRRVLIGATEQHHLDRLSGVWRMSPTWRALCRGVVAAGHPPVGFLITLGGFVVAGADIVDARWAGDEVRSSSGASDSASDNASASASASASDGDGDSDPPSQLTRFDLRPPGEWYDDWCWRQLPTYVGGAALRVWPLGWRAPWERSLG